MGRLADRTVLVTGAGRGIGQGIVEKCSREGARVVVTDVDLENAENVANSLDEAMALRLDVSDSQAVSDVILKAQRRFGAIDIWVNNAGFDIMGPFIDSKEEDWRKIININLFGVLNCSKAILPSMIEQEYGKLLNIASDAGRVGSSGEAVYSAAKGGIIAFTKTLAREVARHGINVNCIAPGPTNTAMFQELSADLPKLGEALKKAIPFRRLAEAQDIANAAAFLVSDEASYITGQTLSVSGGLTMA